MLDSMALINNFEDFKEFLEEDIKHLCIRLNPAFSENFERILHPIQNYLVAATNYAFSRGYIMKTNEPWNLEVNMVLKHSLHYLRANLDQNLYAAVVNYLRPNGIIKLGHLEPKGIKK